MAGAVIALKNYTPAKGIFGSDWVGLKHFYDFFSSVYFGRVLKNTLFMSFYTLVFGFPAPVILALLLNEVRCSAFKRTVQTVSYIPHFISLVVICGMISEFAKSDGILMRVIQAVTGARFEGSLLQAPELFVPIYVISGIWQETGWGTIIYLAALSSVDPTLYEAAVIDGAGRWKQTRHVTLPGIMPTIAVLLILRMGNIMNIGFEKIILLYSPATYATADVISSFVYRKGILEQSWSFSTAVGLFNSVVNLILIASANYLSKKRSGEGSVL
jgi:putative aldouronate transport system permease protein